MKPLLLAAALAPLASLAPAQVVVTEVHPGAGWIEIQNRGSATAELGGWSLLCTTATPGWPNAYWWAFPNNRTLAPGAFLVVHWCAPWQAPSASELWTGNGIGDFLFGLGGEPLRANIGSVALLASQNGADMGTPAVYRDWLTWGRANQPRESYAVLAGRWQLGMYVPAPGPNESIALAQDPAPEPTPPSAFYVDATPSPLRANQQGASVSYFGSDCAVGVMNAPALEVRGVPAAGNPAFGLRALGTRGNEGQMLVLLLGFGRGTGTVLPIPQMSCPLWVDVGVAPFFTIVLPATPGQPFTDLPLSLASMSTASIGWTVYVQAIAGVLPLSAFDHAASGGVAITFGG